MLGDPCRPRAQGDRCDRGSVRPLSCVAFSLTSGPTRDRSSSPSGGPWENGYIEKFNALFAMSCSMARSSTLCARGGGSTMPSSGFHCIVALATHKSQNQAANAHLGQAERRGDRCHV